MCVTQTSKRPRWRTASASAARSARRLSALVASLAPRGEPSAGQTSMRPPPGPNAICAVSMQRHQGLERTRAGFSPRDSNHSPMRRA